jgi:formate/nitrite transporter
MQEELPLTFSPPHQIAPAFVATAVKKAAMPMGSFFLYSVLGGAFIALGGLLSLMVAGGVPGLGAEFPGLIRLISGLLFPLGLVLVVIAGGGLFTSDLATVPFAFWQNKLSLQQVFRVWTWGYLANFVGALLVAWLLAYQTATLTKDPWAGFTKQLAIAKISAPFGVVFAKGIGANLMVCLAVWMAAAARSIGGKVILLWLPVMAFVALGWEHSVANMFFIPLGMLLGAPISLTDLLLNNLLPATLGNLVGGMIFVALPYYMLWSRKSAEANQPTNVHTAVPTTHTPIEKKVHFPHSINPS